MLDSANFQHLEHLALTARRHVDTHLDGGIGCSIDRSVFSYGFSSVVFEVAFSDNVYWVAKVRHAPMDNTDAVYMLSEIATMKLVLERTAIPVPRVFGHQTHRSDDFKFPFVLMEFLPGRKLGGPLARDVPENYLPKVARQLADILFKLENRLSFKNMGILWCGSDCAAPPRVISLPSRDSVVPFEQITLSLSRSPQTSREWFYSHRQDENKEVIKQHPNDPEWNTACWVLKDALSRIIVEERVFGPFPLCHMDLHYGNLLFDEEYNLVGVLDWGKAQTVPLERLAVSPEFVAGELCSEKHKESLSKLLSLMRDSLEHMPVDSIWTRVFCNNSSTVRTPGNEHNADDDTEPVFDDAWLYKAGLPTLCDISGTEKVEIANKCTLSKPRVALWHGRVVQKLVFGEHVSWDQMVLAFGTKLLN